MNGSFLGSSMPPSLSCENGHTDLEAGALEREFLQRALNDTSDSDEDREYADPMHDDLYARRVLLSEHQTSVNADSDKFLPKYWTPEEDLHVGKIRLGSQRRPWYKKLQGFRFVLFVSRDWVSTSKNSDCVSFKSFLQINISYVYMDTFGLNRNEMILH